MDELKREGRLEVLNGMSRCRRIPSWLQNQGRGQEDLANGVVRHERKRMRKKNP